MALSRTLEPNRSLMKRLIKDILTEQGCVKDGVLRYIVEQDGKLYAKRKNVADSDQEIGTVVDSTPIFDCLSACRTLYMSVPT